MEKEKNNKVLIIVLVIFVILTLILGGYLLYDKALSRGYDNNDVNSNEQTSNQDVVDNNQQQNDDKNTDRELTEEEKYFDEYLAIFLPMKSANNFLRNIDNFSNDDITTYLFWYYYHMSDHDTDMPDENGVFTYNVSKTAIDELVYKMFGIKEYEIIERGGRTGLRKIDENTYQAYWFATGWMAPESKINNVKIDGNSAVVEYDIIDNLSSITKTGKMKLYLTKNSENWNINKIEYIEN